MPAQRLTACLIAQDERERLPAALASVAFCDEIVVVDGGSTDSTAAIARAAGAHVIENPWPGFAAQRNVALEAATNDWVLELDADERVSVRLRESIERLLAGEPHASVAVCPLRNRFLGGTLQESAKYPAYRTRLFRRSVYRHDETRAVHEGIEPRERPAVLEGDLEHELAGTLSEALLDAWRYARLESRHIHAGRNPARYAAGILVRPLAKLAYRTVVDAGWRDGWRGMLKIGLDTASDSLVWTLGLARLFRRERRDRAEAPLAPTADGSHFGRRPAGPAKVVAVAADGPDAQAARRWLAMLREGGADVVLVTGRNAGEDRSDDRNRAAEDSDETPSGELPSDETPSDELPVRRLGRLGPLATMRALDLEMQIRTVHAVVAFGRHARLVCRLLPPTLRPSVAGLHAGLAPEQALQRLGLRGGGEPVRGG